MSGPRAIASAACAAALLVGCGKERAAPFDGPDLVLVTIDTLRADHLGCYGYERGTSPAIDALAAKSVHFERAYATSSWTLPSIASIMN